MDAFESWANNYDGPIQTEAEIYELVENQNTGESH